MASSAPVRARRKAPAERREEILTCAASLALDGGLERLTARRIAKQAGIAPALINHYFETFDVLVAEAFERALERDFAALERHVEAGDEPLARLRRFLDQCLNPARAPSQQLWLGAWAEAPRNAALHHRVVTLMNTWVQLTTRLITDAVASDSVDGRDVESIARRLFVLLDGFTVQVVMRQNLEVDDLPGLARAFVERELQLPIGALGLADG